MLYGVLMSKNVLKLAKKEYLTDLGLVIEPNQFTFLVAPTGAGKTTLTMEELCTRQISQNPYPIRVLPS